MTSFWSIVIVQLIRYSGSEMQRLQTQHVTKVGPLYHYMNYFLGRNTRWGENDRLFVSPDWRELSLKHQEMN